VSAIFQRKIDLHYGDAGVSLQIKAVYVITACVMAAPCALAISKMVYPETKWSKFMTYEGMALDKT